MAAFKNNNIVQAWLVLLLATIFGTALAGIQMKLNPVIEANKLKETVEKIPALILGESKVTKTSASDLKIESRVVRVEKNGISRSYPIYDVRSADGNLVGHVVKARGQGYADKIEILLGLDAGGQTISGLFILDQKETPGLGNRIIEKSWRDQFAGKPAGTRLSVVKDGTGAGHEIDGISGATISSRSVTGIVNAIVADTGPILAQTPETTKNSDIHEKTGEAE